MLLSDDFILHVASDDIDQRDQQECRENKRQSRRKDSDFPSLYFVCDAKDNDQYQQGEHGIEDCERHAVVSFGSSVLPMIAASGSQSVAEGISHRYPGKNWATSNQCQFVTDLLLWRLLLFVMKIRSPVHLSERIVKTPPQVGGVLLENHMIGSRIFPEDESS